VSSAPFEELHRHLRRLLRVRDDTGRRLLFRYYDPIVLAAFLPSCTTGELAQLYGPIDTFLVEDGASPAIRQYRFDGVALHTRIRAADPDAAVAEAKRC
jgi:hypothetical protein